MIIYKKFRLEPDGERYNLYRVQVVKKEGENKGKERLVIVGYGYKLDNALIRIGTYEAQESLGKTDIELKEYLSLLKKFIQEAKDCFIGLID